MYCESKKCVTIRRSQYVGHIIKRLFDNPILVCNKRSDVSTDKLDLVDTV